MSEARPEHYILVGKTPIAVDMLTWAIWLESHGDERQIARTVIDPELGVDVSTIFLGLDHSFGGGEPVLFETIAFVPAVPVFAVGRVIEHDAREERRYCTYAEAEAGHAEIVASTAAWLETIRHQSALPLKQSG